MTVKSERRLELIITLDETAAVKLYHEINPVPLPGNPPKIPSSEVKEIIEKALGYTPENDDDIPF